MAASQPLPALPPLSALSPPPERKSALRRAPAGTEPHPVAPPTANVALHLEVGEICDVVCAAMVRAGPSLKVRSVSI